MSMLDRIKAISDRPVLTMNIPEWDMDICVRGLSARERDQLEDALFLDGKVRDRVNFRTRQAAAYLCNPDGSRLDIPDAMAALGDKSLGIIDRIINKGVEASNNGPAAIDEAVKNSDAAL